jgi:type IV secretory pathway protease TraF
MPLAQALLPLAVVNLLIIGIQAVFLWLAARWFSIPGLRYARAFVACLAIGVICLGVGAAGAATSLHLDEMSLGQPDPTWATLQPAVPLTIFLMQVVVAWLGVKWLVGGWWDQAALAAVSMLVAGFVAALVLNGTVRARVMEAYCVPRAAMAPTVLGVHSDVTCTNCNFSYPYHMGDRMHAPRWSLRSPKPTVCPNCGQDAQVPASAAVHSGDTVLVDKLVRPRRWDMVLYRRAPEAGQTPHMYLKRLVGLSGETVEIVGGDLFVGGRRLAKDPYVARDMWIPVHDTQLAPVRPLVDGPKWLAPRGSKWKPAGGKWTIAASGEKADPLGFSGRIEDTLAYNDREPRDAPAPRVGDVKLDCTLQEFTGKGSLNFLWEFRGQKASARVSANGEVEIVCHVPPAPGATTDAERVTVSGHLAGGLHAGQQLTFAVRDGQAYLEQGGILVAILPFGPKDVQAAKSPVYRVTGPCQIALVVSRSTATISRLVLWRDVYYRSLDEMPGSPLASGWGCTNHPLAIPEGSFYLLGDNGLRSQDSRALGAIESSELVGVARWIYWPPSRWRPLR